MESSTLMYNSYNPYGIFNQDIGHIIETEKKINEDKIKHYNKVKEKLIPLKEIKKINKDGNTVVQTVLDVEHVSENVTFVFNEMFQNISKREYSKLFEKSKWKGIGYIFIIVYLCYFISKL